MNFCVQEIGTTIISSQVESDGFEAENLLKKLVRTDPKEEVKFYGFGDPGKSGQGKGFMADYYVRPPVTLKLTFPLYVNISHIVLAPKVGKQESSAFLLQTEILEGGRYGQRSEDGRSTTKTEVIGKEYINFSPIPEVLVFRNPRFILRPEFHSLPLGLFEVHRNSQEAFCLKHHSYNACEDVLALEITILRVSGSSSPALGSLQVWGQPSRHCSKSDVKELLSKYRIHNSKKRLPGEVNNDKDGNDGPLQKLQKTDPPDDKLFPEDFLDPITNEVMCQPMRLPSGIAVDLVTLEKFTTAEAHWGRPPKDPFTGKCFTESLKPIPDAALKSRIDLFLTKNSEVTELKTLPRTLGRIGGEAGVSIAVAASSSRDLKADSMKTKPKKYKCDFQTSLNSNQNSSHKSQPATDRISQEVAKLLNGGTSYLRKSVGDSFDNPNSQAQCLFCQIRQSIGTSALAFYKSSCGHIFMCRNCLVSSGKRSVINSTNFCSRCGLQWTSNDLHRTHT